MDKQKFYDAAFAYKKCKNLKQLKNDEMFAVQLPDGETGYCTVGSHGTKNNSFGLYIGDQAYRSYVELVTMFPDFQSREYREQFFSQTGLMFEIGKGNNLDEDARAEVRQYAAEHNIPLKEGRDYPEVIRLQPMRMPAPCLEQENIDRMTTALSAAGALNKLLKNHSKEKIGLKDVILDKTVTVIPLFTHDGQRWTLQYKKLPDRVSQKEYPKPVLENEVVAKKIRGLKKENTWECEVEFVMLPFSDGDEVDGDAGKIYFPLQLVAVDKTGKKMFEPVSTNKAEENETDLLRFFAAKLKKGKCPQKIMVRNERSFQFLQDLCEKTGIELQKRKNLKALDKVVRDLDENIEKFWKENMPVGELGELEEEDEDLTPEKLNAFCHLLLVASDEEVKALPEEAVKILLELAKFGTVPKKLASRLRKLFPNVRP